MNEAASTTRKVEGEESTYIVRSPSGFNYTVRKTRLATSSGSAWETVFRSRRIAVTNTLAEAKAGIASGSIHF